MRKTPILTDLQKDIIKRWTKTMVVHPSYGSIAKEIGCAPDTVFRTIKKYLSLKNSDANITRKPQKRQRIT